MKVEECMTRPVFSCRPEADMEQAAQLMWEHDCGVLPVVGDEGRVEGLVTDRDLCMGAYTQGKRLHDLRVRDSMSRQVFSCLPSDSLEQAIRTMGDHQVRRIPVVDERGRLLGILSLNDLVRRVVELHDARTRTNLSTRLIEAMAAICEPRGSRAGVLEPLPPARPETVPARTAAGR